MLNWVIRWTANGRLRQLPWSKKHSDIILDIRWVRRKASHGPCHIFSFPTAASSEDECEDKAKENIKKIRLNSQLDERKLSCFREVQCVCSNAYLSLAQQTVQTAFSMQKITRQVYESSLQCKRNSSNGSSLETEHLENYSAKTDVAFIVEKPVRKITNFMILCVGIPMEATLSYSLPHSPRPRGPHIIAIQTGRDGFCVQLISED